VKVADCCSEAIRWIDSEEFAYSCVSNKDVSRRSDSHSSRSVPQFTLTQIAKVTDDRASTRIFVDFEE
jgi:hypothetical protein